MKAGDLVEILAPTMGTKLATGIMGMIIQKSFAVQAVHPCAIYPFAKWNILVNGKVSTYDQSLLKLV